MLGYLADNRAGRFSIQQSMRILNSSFPTSLFFSGDKKRYQRQELSGKKRISICLFANIFVICSPIIRRTHYVTPFEHQ